MFTWGGNLVSVRLSDVWSSSADEYFTLGARWNVSVVNLLSVKCQRFIKRSLFFSCEEFEQRLEDFSEPLETDGNLQNWIYGSLPDGETLKYERHVVTVSASSPCVDVSMAAADWQLNAAVARRRADNSCGALLPGGSTVDRTFS